MNFLKVIPKTNSKFNVLNKKLLSCGVYLFETKKGKPLYVGKSQCLKDRIKTSFKDKFILNDYEVYLRYIITKNMSDASIIEQYLISELNPLYNKADKHNEKTTLIILNIPEFSEKIKISKL
jgi:excinuclease UvrABC nuclease subunit